MTPQPDAVPQVIKNACSLACRVSVLFYLELSHCCWEQEIVVSQNLPAVSSVQPFPFFDNLGIQPLTMALNQDTETMGDKVDVSHEEGMHWGALTEEELVVEKKLRIRIDCLIMPMVILVYLMNYIDRFV